MDAYRQAKIRQLRALIERGEYRVDPPRVADALLQRVSGLGLVRAYELASARAAQRRQLAA